MNKKPMSKKATVWILVFIMAAAILLGFVFLNKGDGPVAGMILSDRVIKDVGAYSDTGKTLGEGVYLKVSNAFNQYQADYEADVPQGETLYAAVHFVECPQGSAFTAKWLRDGAVIAEEDGVLSTGPQGVISFMLDGLNVVSGAYSFELYQNGNRIFLYPYSVK